jgi:tetratricopeptide (TPR) repeat protein
VTEAWWESLSPDEMRDVLDQALQIAPELEAPLRATLRARNGELDGVAAMVDDVLRTRRYLDWRQTKEYHENAQPVLDLLSQQVESHPTQELVELLQRAIKHVLAVIHRADDDGLIGSVLDTLYDMHVQVCARSLPDQKKLATWLIKHTFDSDTFNPPDPVEYAGALGEKGIALYRTAVHKELDGAVGADTYSTAISHGRYAVERLAVIDRDPGAIIASYDHIERASWRELEIARAMREIDRDDLALEHARAGLATSEAFDRRKLVALTASILADTGDLAALHSLRVADHDIRADRTSYAALRDASTSLGRWEADRPAAIVTLGRRNVRELVAVLLEEGRVDEAWDTYRAATDLTLWEKDYLALVAARAKAHPGDAVDAYLALADKELQTSDRRHYEQAIRYVKKAVEPAKRADRGDDVAGHVRAWRETHKRRPSLIQLLDRAQLDP